MTEQRDCVVKLIDDHGVEHSVKVQAQSVYEAALKGLRRLSAVGWEGDSSTIASVLVEVWEEPTYHRVNVPKMMDWVECSGRHPRDEVRKEKLRKLLK